MASLTLHLIVIALLASTALSTPTTPTTPATSTATRQRGRGGVAFQAEGLGPARLTGGVAASTTSTEAPTLRAPRQRRPPTTQSIDVTATVTPIRSRGRGGSAATPLPPVTAPTTARVLQRRRSSTSSTTTTTAATPAAGRSSRDRGSVRGPRQPRDTPEASIRRSWQSAQPTATPYHAYAPTSSPSSSFDSSSSSTSSTTSSRGALKTPRMIQRLVAGHIHNAQGHSTYEVSAVSANSSSSSYGPSTTQSTTPSSFSSPTTSTTTTTTTKQPALRSKTSSSYRLAKPSTRPRSSSTAAPTRFSNPPSTSRATSPLPPPRSNTPNPFRGQESDDDEALLNEPDDFDNWDNGILRLSAGSGKEAEAPAKKPPKEDQKKTLADQVRDGKYGLIEKELFRRVPKRPGVLSYARNSEVPLDNERNYGGLNEEDIWLAEDHLLVIKGGALNEEAGDNQQGPWPAIDDYDAPGRQIKLPANPAVPPPFPVQLEPHGPLQLIRDNQLEILRPAAGNATLSAKGAHHQGHQGAAGEDFASHPAARTGATAASPAAKSAEAGGRDSHSPDAPAYVYPAPYAPWLLYPNDSVASQGLLRTPPLLGPWLINGLNGNGSLVGDSPLPANVSDFDEDDPSLYYPPAYTFVYKSNYSNPVPPGPLVPGIVLPPPPDHFSRLEGSGSTRRPPTPSSTTTTSSTTSSTTTTSTTTTTSRPPVQLPAIRTSYKPKYNGITYLPPPPRQSSPKYVERVPVPVAVPIPIYPVNYTPRPQLVFVPSSTEGSRQEPPLDPPLSKSNPIYYEYFEAKRQPGSIKSNVIDDFLATKPPKRHHHNHNNIGSPHHHQREHLQHYKASPSPANDVAPEVVNITPKPRTAQLQLHAEYEASLGQLLRSNLISPPAAVNVSPGRFQAPDFDKQPFLPMVNYSADEQDQNAFKAIVYQPPGQRQRHLRVGKQQLQLDASLEASPPDSYLPGRHFRVGKQQHQQLQQLQQLQQQPQIYEPQIYSTPVPQFVDDPQQLRPPSPVQSSPLQFWQRPPPQFKRVRPSSKQGHPHPHAHPHPHYPPYYVPGYPSAPSAEPLYRLVPVAQHKHWRNKQPQPPQQVQSQPIQVQAQNQGYPDRSVNIGHSLAGDILVNYNTNNQFNPQAELVPQAQLAAPPPPLSYQAQSGQPLWGDRERDRDRDRDRERSVRQSREQQQ
ncbi:atrophin-1 isoform X2 [Drosophila biarmipes]|nr:atrophin-1 isoform X2 [Drosophila biarmipes]XP_050744628.1 atrophin-1 isoform X2 [Drosophila biarmipes]